MNSTALQNEWYEQKQKLKNTYVFLNNADLDFKVGEKGLMIEKLRIILGKSKEEMLKILELI
jgi:hypothetical protein